MGKRTMGKVIGIDASRCRSGGVQAYVEMLLNSANPQEYGISKIHLWSYKDSIDKIPDYPWLIKHNPPCLEKSIIHQLWWQYYTLPKELRKMDCELLFNTDGGSICPFRPYVSISQDMLSFEPGEMERYGISKARLRLILLWYIQARSFKGATGVVYPTKYVQTTIQKETGIINKNSVIIPHGIADKFRQVNSKDIMTIEDKKPIQCLYVSNADLYKHQWHVIEAVGKIRKMGINISLLLVGGGKGRAQKLLEQQLALTDPNGEFIEQKAFVEHDKIPGFLAKADIFIFASSCENMPITLLEGMGSGLPIACSNRGPMPEVLGDAGVYFDPEVPDSIAQALEKLIRDSVLREDMMKRAKAKSEQYSWENCAIETWKFLGASS